MSFKDYKEAALGLLILLVPLSVIIGGIQSIIEAHTTPELSEAQLQEIQHELMLMRYRMMPSYGSFRAQLHRDLIHSPMSLTSIQQPGSKFR